MSDLYLVDASIYVFRSYYSIPTSFFARDGELVNAVYGYTQFLLDLVDRKPEFISVAFDESLITCYRNRIYPDYKGNRGLPDKNLEYQLAKCQEVTSLLGFHNLCLYDYEADDIIGTLLKKFGKNHKAIIVTRDKDLGQLLRDGDRLWDFAANEYAGRAEIKAKFGVEAEQLPDLLALAGDAVDNIPGAPGIGAKTAVSLLNEFGSLNALLKNPAAVEQMPLRGAKKVRAILEMHQDMVRMFREITEINCKVPMQVKLADLRLTPANSETLLAFCDEMAFGNRIRDRMSKVGAHE